MDVQDSRELRAAVGGRCVLRRTRRKLRRFRGIQEERERDGDSKIAFERRRQYADHHPHNPGVRKPKLKQELRERAPARGAQSTSASMRSSQRHAAGVISRAGGGGKGEGRGIVRDRNSRWVCRFLLRTSTGTRTRTKTRASRFVLSTGPTHARAHTYPHPFYEHPHGPYYAHLR